MWWCGESQLLVLRSTSLPISDTILYCQGPHVHVCGPLSLYILILSVASCKQPPLGHLLGLGIREGVVWSTLGWAIQGGGPYRP